MITPGRRQAIAEQRAFNIMPVMMTLIGGLEDFFNETGKVDTAKKVHAMRTMIQTKVIDFAAGLNDE